jgi:hypothetical protein
MANIQIPSISFLLFPKNPSFMEMKRCQIDLNELKSIYDMKE